MQNPLQSRSRVDWIDYAKGIGIVLVVLGHVLRGLTRSSVGASNWNELQALDAWIYAFHMPLFFFISGLLWRLDEARPIKQFLFDKLRSIMYPYVIWTAVVEGLRVISGQSKDSLSNFIVNYWRIIYQPIDILWFLYTLFLISMIYFLLRKINIAPLYIWVGSIILYFCHMFLPELLFWDPLDKIGIYSAYFVLGTLIKNWLAKKSDLSTEFLALGTVVGFTILTILVHFSILASNDPNLALGVLGSISCLFLAKLLSQLEWLKFLRTVGSLSLQIYVAHTIATGFTRIILLKLFQIDTLIIHIILGVMAGICLPLLLNWGANRINFPYLFAIPRRTKAV